jgi:hypothetical protein
MTKLAAVAGVVLAIAATTGLVWGSRAPIAPDASDDAILRLAWRARPDRVEDCRPADAETLKQLPAHMRQQMICEGVAAAYRLEVRQDGQVITDEAVHAAGLRQDRPIYVFREIRVPPGEHTVSVRFSRQGDATPQPGAVPPELSLERRFPFRPRTVVLVTYEPERRELVAMGDF